jgi:hypothetical protein
MEAKNAAPRAMIAKEVAVRRVIKIGRPGYTVRYGRDATVETNITPLFISLSLFSCPSS